MGHSTKPRLQFSFRSHFYSGIFVVGVGSRLVFHLYMGTSIPSRGCDCTPSKAFASLLPHQGFSNGIPGGDSVSGPRTPLRPLNEFTETRCGGGGGGGSQPWLVQPPAFLALGGWTPSPSPPPVPITIPFRDPGGGLPVAAEGEGEGDGGSGSDVGEFELFDTEPDPEPRAPGDPTPRHHPPTFNVVGPFPSRWPLLSDVS